MACRRRRCTAGRKRRPAAPAVEPRVMAVALAAGMWTHYYSVLAFLPILVGESSVKAHGHVRRRLLGRARRGGGCNAAVAVPRGGCRGSARTFWARRGHEFRRTPTILFSVHWQDAVATDRRNDPDRDGRRDRVSPFPRESRCCAHDRRPASCACSCRPRRGVGWSGPAPSPNATWFSASPASWPRFPARLDRRAG